jgi:hypothetical protein
MTVTSTALASGGLAFNALPERRGTLHKLPALLAS